MLSSTRDRRVVPTLNNLPPDEHLVNGVHWKVVHIPGNGFVFEGKEDGRLVYRSADEYPSLRMKDAMEAKLAEHEGEGLC